MLQRERPSRPHGPCWLPRAHPPQPHSLLCPGSAPGPGFPAAEQAGGGGEEGGESPRAAEAGAGCRPVCCGAEQHVLPCLAVAPRPLAQAPLGRSGFGGKRRGGDGLERGTQPRPGGAGLIQTLTARKRQQLHSSVSLGWMASSCRSSSLLSMLSARQGSEAKILHMALAVLQRPSTASGGLPRPPPLLPGRAPEVLSCPRG